jgi:hypothetical protein
VSVGGERFDVIMSFVNRFEDKGAAATNKREEEIERIFQCRE